MKGRVELRPGAVVEYGGGHYTITHVLDLHTVLAKSAESDAPERLEIHALAEPHEASAEERESDVELSRICDEDWMEANRRAAIVRSILEAGGSRRSAVHAKARETGIHAATLYRWIRAYESSGCVTALLPSKPKGGKGRSRLDAAAEEIVRATIDEFYLSSQQRSPRKTAEEVELRCRRAGVAAPHASTIRRRIAALDDRLRLERRGQARKARSTYTPLRGEFPGADFPLAVVQIDHTKVDLVLVDDVYRRPVGRPWITVAIDVFSRMVLGFYVSFDPPSGLSAGMCVAHAILPKEVWLAKRDITIPWPCWGVPRAVHLDNAREFRGQMLRRACQQYGIEVDFRPVLEPTYGGHIERLLGTFAEEIHALPGTTFASPKARGEYDSKKEAVVTLSELETWLATYITGVYHQRLHAGIGTSPLARFESGIFGSAERPGAGLPARLTDEERVRLDFMPFVERTVQPYGVVVDGVHYYSDVLRRHVNARDPKDATKKRVFVFKRDPRDISRLYFFDPEMERYFAVPYRDTARPAISVWELREATRAARQASRAGIDEALIFATLDRLREQEARSREETRRSRRSRVTRGGGSPRPAKRAAAKAAAEPAAKAAAEEWPEVIAPFDELEELG